MERSKVFSCPKLNHFIKLILNKFLNTFVSKHFIKSLEVKFLETIQNF
ncbi:hypothetical protein HMPREF9225_0911 [Peptoniphilus duerdenii ATCC BAA-1640]|uniref:Uncharacterized protein n=1 Tax=Peptoniphilus duerdenii ATCC BAA-1640 TaxID=862517 RepID=E0NL72_9FIRM|nr:hypothetical protein HMPREF9225_0911 [Peptoniphilus duerdenii ATCC BAA-1640]